MYNIFPRLRRRGKFARPANLQSAGVCAGRRLLLLLWWLWWSSHQYVPVFYLVTTKTTRRRSAAGPGSTWTGILLLLLLWFWRLYTAPKPDHLHCCRPSSPTLAAHLPLLAIWLQLQLAAGTMSAMLRMRTLLFLQIPTSRTAPRTKRRVAYYGSTACPVPYSRCGVPVLCWRRRLLSVCAVRIYYLFACCAAIFPGTCSRQPWRRRE